MPLVFHEEQRSIWLFMSLRRATIRLGGIRSGAQTACAVDCYAPPSEQAAWAAPRPAAWAALAVKERWQATLRAPYHCRFHLQAAWAPPRPATWEALP